MSAKIIVSARIRPDMAGERAEAVIMGGHGRHAFAEPALAELRACGEHVTGASRMRRTRHRLHRLTA